MDNTPEHELVATLVEGEGWLLHVSFDGHNVADIPWPEEWTGERSADQMTGLGFIVEIV